MAASLSFVVVTFLRRQCGVYESTQFGGPWDERSFDDVDAVDRSRLQTCECLLAVRSQLAVRGSPHAHGGPVTGESRSMRVASKGCDVAAVARRTRCVVEMRSICCSRYGHNGAARFEGCILRSNLNELFGMRKGTRTAVLCQGASVSRVCNAVAVLRTSSCRPRHSFLVERARAKTVGLG
jgi:hypothetical protein